MKLRGTLIAHSTILGVTSTENEWDLTELISKAVDQCDAFHEWIKDSFSVRVFNTWTGAVAAQAKTRAIWRAIKERSLN